MFFILKLTVLVYVPRKPTAGCFFTHQTHTVTQFLSPAYTNANWKKVEKFWTGTVFFHIPTFHAGVNLGSQVRVLNFLFRLLKMAGNILSVFVFVFHESFGSANNHRNGLNDIPSCSFFSRDSKDIEQNFKKLYQFWEQLVESVRF